MLYLRESKELPSIPPKAGTEQIGVEVWCVDGCEEDAEISPVF